MSRPNTIAHCTPCEGISKLSPKPIRYSAKSQVAFFGPLIVAAKSKMELLTKTIGCWLPSKKRTSNETEQGCSGGCAKMQAMRMLARQDDFYATSTRRRHISPSRMSVLRVQIHDRRSPAGAGNRLILPKKLFPQTTKPLILAAFCFFAQNPVDRFSTRPEQ